MVNLNFDQRRVLTV